MGHRMHSSICYTEQESIHVLSNLYTLSQVQIHTKCIFNSSCGGYASVWVALCGITYIVVMLSPPWLCTIMYTVLRQLALNGGDGIPPLYHR